MIEARVEDHAWITSGAPAREVSRLDDQISRAVAERGNSWIHQYLERVFRYSAGPPTGRYLSHTRVTRATRGYEVTVSNVVYDAWIEGTGSRNSPHSRFPGYHAFRRAAQLMNREAQRIADRIVDRWIRRHNA